jgi:hypothetical protein
LVGFYLIDEALSGKPGYLYGFRSPEEEGVSDFFMYSAIEYYRKMGCELLLTGMCNTPGLLRFKKKWGVQRVGDVVEVDYLPVVPEDTSWSGWLFDLYQKFYMSRSS